MFEKEAEEIANKKLCSERICYNHCNFNSPKHHRCGEWHRIYDCAKESAEFGYNKSKEELEEENAELKEKVSYLEDNLRVARKDRENLQLKVGKGLKEFIKDCPYSALKLYANGYYVEQLTKAKELIEELSSSLSVVGECGGRRM